MFRYCADAESRHMRKHLSVGIALDKMDWNSQIAQTREGFARHWTGDHITADHQQLDVCLRNLVEDGLKRGKIAVNIIDCSNMHNKSFERRQSYNGRTAAHSPPS